MPQVDVPAHSPHPEHAHATDLQRFMNGECHIFAAASVIHHGGSFLVAFDQGKPHWELDDETVFEVLHVYACLPGPDGPVIRDIRGDRPDTPYRALAEELAAEFSVHPDDLNLETQTASELLALVSDRDGVLADALNDEPLFAQMDHDDRPLAPVDEAGLAAALALEEVRTPPGVRATPDRDEICSLTPM